MDWVQARLLAKGIWRSRGKSRMIFPGGVEAEDLSANQLAEFERADFTVAGRGVMAVGVPSRTRQHQKGLTTTEASYEPRET